MKSLCGFRPSLHDIRDWVLAKFGVLGDAAIPESLDYLNLIDEIYNQAGPSCTGESTARAWNLRARIQGDSAALYPDPLALYALGRAREADEWAKMADKAVDPLAPLDDNGAMPRHVLAAASECGVVARGSLDLSDRTKRPPWAAIRGSADRRGIQYARIGTAREGRLALAAGHPIKDGGTIDTSYTDIRTLDEVWDGPVGEAIGGHDRCIIGYRPGAFLEVNSWGSGDGANGLRWISDRAFEGSECWAVELVNP